MFTLLQSSLHDGACLFRVVLVFAVFAVIATALAQIFTNTYQKSLDCNALQLLHHTSPYIALGEIIVIIISCEYDMPQQSRTDLSIDSLIKFVCLVFLHRNVDNVSDVRQCSQALALPVHIPLCFASSHFLRICFRSQHIQLPCDWEDISLDLSGLRTFKDDPHPCFGLHSFPGIFSLVFLDYSFLTN